MTWDLRPSRSGNARPRVLCVDDESVILQMLRRLLEVQGFEPVTCGDPLLALTVFDEGSFDVVITDMRMPDMNGAPFLAVLQVDNSKYEQLLVNTLGPIELWALSTTPGDTAHSVA